jgi:histone H3/H4
MTNIPEFAYVQAQDIKKGSGDIVVRKTWNTKVAIEAIKAYIVYKASSINDSMNNKIGNITNEYSLKNMVSFLSTNHNVGGYDDSDFDKINTEALREIEKMTVHRLVGSILPEKYEGKTFGIEFEEGLFDEKAKEKMGQHLIYAKQHDEMAFSINEIDSLEVDEVASFDKVNAFTLGDLTDEKATNLNFITFFDITDPNFQEYFGEILPIYLATKSEFEVKEEIRQYIQTLESEDVKNLEAIRGIVTGVSNYVDMAIGNYISGILGKEFEEGISNLIKGEDLYKYKRMKTIKISPSEIGVIQRNLLPLGVESAKRKAIELFGTDTIIQPPDYPQRESIITNPEGFSPDEDYLGKTPVEINLEAMSREEWNTLVKVLIEYGVRGDSKSLQGKAKRIVLDATENYVDNMKEDLFGNLVAFKQFENEYDNQMLRIQENAVERLMVKPSQKPEEARVKSDAIYINENELAKYMERILTEETTKMKSEGENKYTITFRRYAPYNIKYGESVLKTKNRRKEKIKYPKTKISFQEEGKTTRQRANRPGDRFKKLLNSRDEDFTIQMRTLRRNIINSVSDNFDKYYALIQILTSSDELDEMINLLSADDNVVEESVEGLSLDDYEGLKLLPNQVPNEGSQIIELINLIQESLDDEQVFIANMKRISMDREEVDEIMDSYESLSSMMEQSYQRLSDIEDIDIEDLEVYLKQFNTIFGYTLLEKTLSNPKYKEPAEGEIERLVNSMGKSDQNPLGVEEANLNKIKEILEPEYNLEILSKDNIAELKKLMPRVKVEEATGASKDKIMEEGALVNAFKGIASNMAGTDLADITKFGRLTLEVTVTDDFIEYSGEYTVEGNARPQITSKYISYGKGSKDGRTTASGYKTTDVESASMISNQLLDVLEKIRVAMNTISNAI